MREGQISDEADVAVQVADYVMDKRGHPRWAVVATFVGAKGSEPRCIDYRVRVIPEQKTRLDALMSGRRVVEAMTSHARDRSADFLAAEVAAPAEGIPRRVFEVASQSRLLHSARSKAKRDPSRVKPAVRQLLERQDRRRSGRPPVRSLDEKLAVLQLVERAYAEGRNLGDVAAEVAMSRSAVRDLVAWARHDAVPPLFTNYGPGRRGGELTDEARTLLHRGGR